MGMIQMIRDAGVVGAGGAGFPTDRKLDCKAEILIINGIECEPLLRTDRHVMETYAMEIVLAVRMIRDNLKAKRAVIALKKHYEKAVEALRDAVKGTKVELYLSDSFYPAGDEQNLVYCVTGRTVPTGGIPLDVGCVVSNVSTVLNIARALEGQPVTEKMVTVAGSVANPVTVNCAIGTPLSLLLDAAGGPVGDCTYIIGGPLMGRVTDDLSEPVTKTTGGLLAIPKGHTILSKKMLGERDAMLARAVCCQCSMCTQMCPRNAMGLDVQPHKAMRAFASGNGTLLGRVNGIFSCCDCGVCTYYACNFGLKPGKVMQEMKGALQKNGVRPVKEVKYKADSGIENKRVPTERLLQRLDLKKFDRDAPMAGFVDCDEVRIPLRMHIGAPDKPVVQAGQRVHKGDLIAEPQGMGARIHASIDGTVTRVTDQTIEIRK
ncbi:MAG: 4Fe-4S dicluster domain-containing protein [Clostridiales bacterium]|nr:4Fe-4S dicluster domain-containing protein [Clostridiales bacterium]